MPLSNSNSTPAGKEFRKWRRIHGLQLPLHPQQVISWVFLLSFTIYIFLTLIPAIHSSAQLPLLMINLVVFGVHYVSHFTSLLIDPSDPALLALYSNKPVPQLDKSRFNHVIENGRCHLCDINITTVRTKHCSVCNKCVHVFDHHCKWLNQCIGRRNYLPFFICVVSAILMCLSFITLSVTEMTLFFSRRQLLSPWQHYTEQDLNITTTTLLLPDFESLSTTISTTPITTEPGRNSTITGRSLFLNINQPSPVPSSVNNNGHTVQNSSLSYGLFLLSPGSLHLFFYPVPDSLFLTVTAIATFVALLCAGLLLHLCIFHVYINVTGMTTYEYVRAQRISTEQSQRESSHEDQHQMPKTTSTDPEESKCECSLIMPKRNKIQPESYLNFGGKKKGPPRPATASTHSTTDQARARPSTNGLRKLQKHLESVQEDNEEEAA